MEGAFNDPAVVITDSMLAVDHALAHVPPRDAVQLIEFCRRRLDATEARLLADRYEKGASDRDVENMAAGDDGKTSKAEAKKKARRAKATNANPALADRLENGTMSTEQADIVASAAEDTDGAAACDDELIDAIASTNPEQGKKKAREYVNKRTRASDLQKRYDRQHRRRGVYKHRLPNGNSALTMHGPDEEIDELERAIHAGSNAEYQADGGRDVPRSKHPRTHDQRNFDAAKKLLTEQPEGGSKRGARIRRSTVFVTATVEQLSGRDSTPLTSIDGKPLPQSFVEDIAGDANFIAQLFSEDGELLWQGRESRLATPAQIRGLTSRDKGCVQCQAPVERCVAHHLLPWEAPRKGPTNINNLVLLCVDCHVRLHAAKQTMFYDIASQTWKVRQAAPDEIPPDRRARSSGSPPEKEPPGRYAKPKPWERQPKPGIRPGLSHAADSVE